MERLIPAAAVLLSFLLGAIPFGWIVFRLRAGRDIRHVGSGNIGATNVFRFQGKGWGLLVLLLDALKGAAPTYAAWRLFGPHWTTMAVAAAAVLGHCFTPWLGFRGGKGVATGLGALVVLAPIPVSIALGVFLAVVWATGYVSLGSMLAALAAALLTTVFGKPLPIVVGVWACALLVIGRHHANIRRLIQGTEGKLGTRHPSEAA